MVRNKGYQTRLLSPSTMTRDQALHLFQVYVVSDTEAVRCMLLDLTGEEPKALSEDVPFLAQGPGVYSAACAAIRAGIVTHARYLVNVEPAGVLLERQLEENVRLDAGDTYHLALHLPEFAR